MYDYRNAMIQDIKKYLTGNDIKVTKDNREELEEKLNDDLFVEDSVTGNASGSYTFNRYTAEIYVKDNIKLCIDALCEFGISAEELGRKLASEEYEYLDVTIRCYLLGECLAEVLDELETIEEAYQGLPETEKVIREKLTDYFRDNFTDSDWLETFDHGTTSDIIEALYNSYCDDCFWAIAHITLREICDYLEEKFDSDSDKYGERFAYITSYYLNNATDLLV